MSKPQLLSGVSDLFGIVPQPVIIAYGGGVDSTAMIIGMVARGERIDMVLFADTGSEKPATYIYVWMFSAWLERHGIPFQVVRYEAKNFKHYPPYRSLDENCFTNGTLPSISFNRHSCSIKWKVEPQNRWTERWEPAQRIWAAGGKVIKCIGYDNGARDKKRYAHAEGHLDDRFAYRYPLQEWGWDRDECERQIAAAGLPVPVKSACFMCGAMQPWEVHTLPVQQLRRIVLMEARAAPRLRNIVGLWQNGVKGMRGATKRPGKITDYIRSEGLLPADEIDAIWNLAPAALLRWQEAQADLPARPDLAEWFKLFDARDAGIFDADQGHRFYDREGMK